MRGAKGQRKEKRGGESHSNWQKGREKRRRGESHSNWQSIDGIFSLPLVSMGEIWGERWEAALNCNLLHLQFSLTYHPASVLHLQFSLIYPPTLCVAFVTLSSISTLWQAWWHQAYTVDTHTQCRCMHVHTHNNQKYCTRIHECFFKHTWPIMPHLQSEKHFWRQYLN